MPATICFKKIGAHEYHIYYPSEDSRAHLVIMLVSPNHVDY